VQQVKVNVSLEPVVIERLIELFKKVQICFRVNKQRPKGYSITEAQYMIELDTIVIYSSSEVSFES
jgi:hypothetical protein